MVLAIDSEVLPVDSRLQSAVHRLKKIIAMRLDVKSNQVGAEHSVNQFPLPRADAKRLRVRPGNVPEDCNPSIRTFALNQSRNEREMVVLQQQQRLLEIGHLFERSIGKLLIDLAISLPVRRTEDRASVRDVTQRPQPFIREAEVITFLFFFG